jgi:putative addiction module killer protein
VEARPIRVQNYVAHDNSCPFEDWLDGLRDLKAVAQIDKRVARLRLGLLGEFNAVGGGVLELIFRGTGPGYRIYCGQDGQDLVILLGGGVKRGQQSDIDDAKERWRDYKREE